MEATNLAFAIRVLDEVEHLDVTKGCKKLAQLTICVSKPGVMRKEDRPAPR